MATITKKKLLSDYLPFSGVPYGNALNLDFGFETNASGVWTQSDTTSAVGSGDKLRIGMIPAGTRITGGLGIVSDAFRASTTGKIGFEYVDGVDSTDVPQDDDYFFAALALDATGRTAANNLAVRPITLPKDAYVTFVNGVAAQNVVGKFDLVITGSVVGQP